MVNIVCLKWGTKYGAEYVNNLYASIKRHTSKKFKFWCFTDDAHNINPEVNIAPLPFANQLDSWWNKLYLFNKDLPIPADEKIFYIDLDTLIVDNIDAILGVKVTKEVAVLRDFYYGIAKSAGLIGSGLMAWRHGRYHRLWENFVKNPDKVIKQAHPHGDQWYIEQQIKRYKFWQDVCPDQVVSFKVHCRDGIPNKAAIICYHGRPSIPESIVDTTDVGRWVITPQPWVAYHWNSVDQCRVRFAKIPARNIFGMVGRCGGGYNSLWEDWSIEGRHKRELIMKEFEQELNHICGHYDKLETSILEEGIRNPVIVTCGYPVRRSLRHLPPELKNLPPQELLLLEGTTGGSRLHIAQKYNLTINCIVNDWTGRFNNCPEIVDEGSARIYYTDQPDQIMFNQSTGMYTEGFDNQRKAYHLEDNWSEDQLMPLRAPMWISILNKHGYKINQLSQRVLDVLKSAGIQQ